MRHNREKQKLKCEILTSWKFSSWGGAGAGDVVAIGSGIGAGVGAEAGIASGAGAAAGGVAGAVVGGALAASAVAGWAVGTAIYNAFSDEIQEGLAAIF